MLGIKFVLVKYFSIVSNMNDVDWQTERTIFKTRDEYGEILVKDQGLVRSLYFGNDKKQTSVLLPNLGTLILFYTQAMMSSLLFVRQPKKVLLIGLGGGSIIHFFAKYFPDVEIDVVELRQSVINVATNYFGLPISKPGLKLYHMDAGEFVTRKARSSDQYDVVFVDAFDQWGPAELVANDVFLQNCRRLVSEHGVCAYNLWNRREDDYGKSLSQLEKVFKHRVFELRLGSINSNAILFAFDRPMNVSSIKNAAKRAQQLKDDTGVEFPKYQKMLLKQNKSMIKRLRKVVF